MSIFLMVRHTRADESPAAPNSSGLRRLVALAMLVAASIWLTVLNVLVAVGNAVSMVALGLPAEGSLALVWPGWGRTGLHGGRCRRSPTCLRWPGRDSHRRGGPRNLYLIRAVGDVGWGWLSWLSPLGWAIGIRAYADERWWVVTAVVGPRAGHGCAGGGPVSPSRLRRRHPATTTRSSPRLGPAVDPLGLVFRLQRASLIGWTVGIAIMGLVMGLIADEAQTLAENDSVAELLTPAATGSLTDAYLATMAVMLALAAGGSRFPAALRLRSEESAVRADPVLAGPIGRVRWAAGYVLVAVGGSAVILVVAGLLTGLGTAVSLNDISEVLPVTGHSWRSCPRCSS